MPPHKSRASRNPDDLPVITDQRFAKIHHDPRFIRPRRKDTKTVIDKRFSHMIEHEDFDFVQKVDKYGRSIAKDRHSNASLKKFYRLEDKDEVQKSQGKNAEDDSSSGEQDETMVSELGWMDFDEHADAEQDIGSDDDQCEKYGSEEASEVESDMEMGLVGAEVEENDLEESSEDNDDDKVDRARGEGVDSCMSSSDDDDSPEQKGDEIEFIRLKGSKAVEEEVNPYETLESQDVPEGEPTRRFAVVNMDWHYINAVDLYKVFDGFKPNGSLIKSVKIYVSEFGKERLAQEEREGPPQEIFANKKPMKHQKESKNVMSEDEASENEASVNEANENEFLDEDVLGLFENENDEAFDNEALRKYQIERMKYYYAVVECDSVATASAIYNHCDGTEFEHSSLLFDLRYIPDDMEFEEQPKDEATDATSQFRPKEFVATALQDSHVKLMWDEDDEERVRVTRQRFTKDDLQNMDFQAYLASSGSDDSEDENEDKEKVREKYRNLLNNDDSDDHEKDSDDEHGDLEITFAPGLSEMASSLLEKRENKLSVKEETVFETYLRKQKEKKKERKQKGEKEPIAQSHDHEDQGFDDPFFQDDGMDMEVAETADREKSAVLKKPPAKKSKKKKNAKGSNEAVDPELELLLMDDENDRLALSKHHFNMDDIVKKQAKSKGKKKAELAEPQEDDFEVNLQDSRFKAILNDPQFAIDPTSNKFKKTKAMDKVLGARKVASLQKPDEVDQERSHVQEREELLTLVNKLKTKTPNVKSYPKK